MLTAPAINIETKLSKFLAKMFVNSIWFLTCEKASQIVRKDDMRYFSQSLLSNAVNYNTRLLFHISLNAADTKQLL